MVAAVGFAAALVAVLVSHNSASAQSITAVSGTTIIVNTEADESNADGDCSLREAIEAANTNAAVDGCAAGSATELDAIHFSLGKAATIVLGSQLPTITDGSGLKINGQRAKITISGNNAVRVFETETGAKLTLARLTVADGNADMGGGLNNNSLVAELTVTDSTFSGNNATSEGGGIRNQNATALTVTNSTFSGNSATEGGGLMAAGDLTVTNSTFSGNSAISGGGINIGGGEIMTLRNTIVANSPSGGNCRNNGILTDGGYNIDDGTTCGFSQANNSLPSTDPKLASGLANNGGPTKTIKLLKGSPAINAIPRGTNGCGTTVTTDQRGVKRPQGSGCDIGAFEKKKKRR
jgi:CSLREA domain-containing protein